MPFEEIHHTADWAMRVTAPDLPGLFVEAARGMNALTGVRLAPGPRSTRTFETAAQDPECLLVSFLSELIYYAEQEHMAFDEFTVTITDQTLRVDLSGTLLSSLDKNIKAVTFHNIKIRQSAQGFDVEIVFDV